MAVKGETSGFASCPLGRDMPATSLANKTIASLRFFPDPDPDSCVFGRSNNTSTDAPSCRGLTVTMSPDHVTGQ